jgi:hypothetical protein
MKTETTLTTARNLITQQMLRWKCAKEATEEAAPSSAANCWVDGYIHGLQQALDWMDEPNPKLTDGHETKD